LKRSTLHNDLALDRILRIQHKGICMWCPSCPPHQQSSSSTSAQRHLYGVSSSTSAIFVCGVLGSSPSAIFFLLPALRATGIEHNALCVQAEAEEALCVCVLKALLHLSRTIRIQKQATSTVAKHTGAAISINYSPVTRACESRSVR